MVSGVTISHLVVIELQNGSLLRAACSCYFMFALVLGHSHFIRAGEPVVVYLVYLRSQRAALPTVLILLAVV